MIKKDGVRVLVSLGFIVAILLTIGMPAYAQVGVSFLVVDSKNKTLGPVVNVWPGGDQYEQATVELPYVGGKWLTVTVQRKGFSYGVLYFTASDCTGPAFYYPADTSPFLLTQLSPKDNVVYMESGAPEQVALNSELAPDNQCFPFIFTQTAVPMTPTISVSNFTPPFSIVRKNW